MANNNQSVNSTSMQLLGSNPSNTSTPDRTAQLQADVQQGQARTNLLPKMDWTAEPDYGGGFWNNVKGGLGMVTQGIGNMVNGKPFLDTTPMGNIVVPKNTNTNTSTKTTNNTNNQINNNSKVEQGNQNGVENMNNSSLNNNQNAPGFAGANSSGSNATNSGAVVNPDGTVSEPQFNVPTNQTTSAAFQNGSTYQDLLAKRQQLENTAQQALTNQLQTQYKGMGDVLNAKYSGDTTDYGIGAGFLAQQRADIQNLGATIPMQVASQQIGYSQQDIANQLAAQPQNSDIYTDPQGNRFIVQRDPTTGYNKQVYQGNIYTGQGANGQPMVGQNQTGNGINNTQTNQSTGSMVASDGGTIAPTYASKVQQMPSILQNYVLTGPQGVAYIDESKITDPALKQSASLFASKAGVPFLTHDDALGLQSIGNLYSTLDQINGLVDQTLKSGVVGKGVDTLEAIANKYTGYKPILTNYQLLRDTAGKAVSALMGGIGSGFRMNMPELDIATSNLPSATDNIQEAKVKIEGVKQLLDNGIKQKFPDFQGTGSLTTGGTSSSNSAYAGAAWK